MPTLSSLGHWSLSSGQLAVPPAIIKLGHNNSWFPVRYLHSRTPHTISLCDIVSQFCGWSPGAPWGSTTISLPNIDHSPLIHNYIELFFLKWWARIIPTDYSDVTWAVRCLNSLAFWQFVQQLIQAKNKHQSSALPALCEGNPSVTSEYPSQTASNEVCPCDQGAPTNDHVIEWLSLKAFLDSKHQGMTIQEGYAHSLKYVQVSNYRQRMIQSTTLLKAQARSPTTLPTTRYGLYILYILTWPQWTPITPIQWPQHMATTASSQNIPIYQTLKYCERSSWVSETSLTSITDSSQTLQYNNPWSAVQDLGERSSEVSKISMANIKDDVRSGQMLMTVLNVIYLMSTKYYSKSWETNNYWWKCVVSTVPADGLAPLGARSSAGTVMTKIRLYIYTQYTWIGAKYIQMIN